MPEITPAPAPATETPTAGTPAPAATPAPAPAPTPSHDGVIEKDGVKYIRHDSYEVVAAKVREHTAANAAREAEEATRKEADMKKKGEFEQLAKAKEEEAMTYKQKFESSVKTNALISEAMKLGAIDLDAVTKLTDMSKIQLSENGDVDAASVKVIVEALKTEKAYLFGSPAPTPANIGNAGGGGAPDGGNAAVRSFKRSELQKHDFFKANEAEILQAYKEGKIIDDIDPA